MEEELSRYTMALVGEPFYSVVGYAATMLYIVFQLPQIYKTWKTKSAKDISAMMLVFHVVAATLMLYYGYMEGSIQCCIANTACATQSIILLYLVFLYGRR